MQARKARMLIFCRCANDLSILNNPAHAAAEVDCPSLTSSRRAIRNVDFRECCEYRGFEESNVAAKEGFLFALIPRSKSWSVPRRPLPVGTHPTHGRSALGWKANRSTPTKEPVLKNTAGPSNSCRSLWKRQLQTQGLQMEQTQNYFEDSER